MNDIALEANASAASINYYFGTKDRLMEATMRRLLGLLKESVIERFRDAHRPKDRLVALIEANFDDRLFTPAQCSLWVQFWSNAPYSNTLSRLHRINRGRVHSHLKSELRQLVPLENLGTVTATIQAYMDGVWLEAAQSGDISAEDARREAVRVLRSLLA